MCRECHACSEGDVAAESHAIAAWNRRPLDAKDARIAALEAAMAGAEERGRLKGLEEAEGRLTVTANVLEQMGEASAAASLRLAAAFLRSLAQQERQQADGGE